MPVIVVGADTPVGAMIIEALVEPDRDVRAFVSDPDAAASLKRLGAKVALGDVSDPSHIEGCCLNCFSAVFVTQAATDRRERAFASDRDNILQGWAEAAAGAGVQRVLWVAPDGSAPAIHDAESAVISAGSLDEIVRQVVDLDNAQDLSRRLRESPPDARS